MASPLTETLATHSDLNEPSVQAPAALSFDDLPLRALTDEQFLARYKTDRFTASILASRMRYVVKHMSTVLLTTAFSMILRDWYDFAATISGPRDMNYPMSTGSDSLSIFMFTMPEGIRNTIEEFGPENLRAGDVIIANDPYRTGLHVNDVSFIRPVFYRGKAVAFVTIRAHQLDMGGVVAGGFSGNKKNVYENGLVISPTLLYRDDKPVRSAFNFIFDNARYGELLLPDIRSLYQSLLLGERLLLESIERYGIDAYLGAIRYSCDVSADSMREAIRTKIPDGVYEAEDGIDADGVDDSRDYRLKLKLTKYGDNIELDFTGTSPQARASINCGPLDVKAAAGVALKMLIEQQSPLSSGCFRNIDVVIPPGTFCSATPPGGPIFMYWEASITVLLAIYKALAPVLGEDAIGGDYGSLMLHNGSGLTKSGQPWLTVGNCGGEHGPWGGTKAGDGDSYTVFHVSNNLDPATEAVESDVPVVVMRKEYVADTAGPGENRGGAAVRRDTLWLADGEHLSIALHAKEPSGIGVYGGRPGTTQACWLFPGEEEGGPDLGPLLPADDSILAQSVPVVGLLDPDTKRVDPNGRYYYYASRKSWSVKAGGAFRFQTGGGGGWGNPLARDPERVKCDVRDEYVTIEGAYRDYGVVIEGDPINAPEQLVVNVEATARRRREMAAA
ncbi:hydantoinase B/oxoprolinase family protein [Rhizorhabdus sp.]|uniref:hydantoinase B/oxoprolinase family protein n=1 Tax=Rhizorhabdus sp. TaxID=1968843 RepID=UPI0035B13661